MACFPLHEGRYDKEHISGTAFDRRVSVEFNLLSTLEEVNFSQLIIAAFVPGMGSTEEMVQEATTVLGAQIFWGQNCIIFLLARFLYKNVIFSRDRWHYLLHIRTSDNGFRIQ